MGSCQGLSIISVWLFGLTLMQVLFFLFADGFSTSSHPLLDFSWPPNGSCTASCFHSNEALLVVISHPPPRSHSAHTPGKNTKERKIHTKERKNERKKTQEFPTLKPVSFLFRIIPAPYSPPHHPILSIVIRVWAGPAWRAAARADGRNRILHQSLRAAGSGAPST